MGFSFYQTFSFGKRLSPCGSCGISVSDLDNEHDICHGYSFEAVESDSYSEIFEADHG